jgi:hypothetical protein
MSLTIGHCFGRLKRTAAAAVGKVLDFFDWAHGSRNKILHSERYPPGLGADRSCHGVVVAQFEIRRS